MLGRMRVGAVGSFAVALLALGMPAMAQQPEAAGSNDLMIYDFEADLEGWEIPDWAKQKDDSVAKEITPSQQVASHGTGSLQILADFPGGRWTGAYVETLMRVTNWSQFGSVSVDIYIPENAPTGLEGRLIFTVGDKWEWSEMNRGLSLQPGKWTTVTANLKAGSTDWKFFLTDAFRADVRKFGVRIESNHKPVYSGVIYIDNIRLGS